MKPVFRILASFLLIILFSCEKGTLFQRKCDDCVAEQPTEADIEVKLTPNSYSNLITTISIFEGNIEDSILLQKFETTSSNLMRTMVINKKYTFVARYYYSGRFYEVINSVTPGAKFEKFLCVSPCYRITDNLCDLRLKYQ